MVPHEGLWHWEFWLMFRTIFLPHSFPPEWITDYFKEYLLKYRDLFGFYLPPSLGYVWLIGISLQTVAQVSQQTWGRAWKEQGWGKEPTGKNYFSSIQKG